jgi:TonB family protein
VVKIVVSGTGDVEGAEVVGGNPVLAKAAISAVEKWKLQPYIRNGKPRKVSTTFPFDFAFSDRITDNPSRDAISIDVPSGKDTQDPGAGTTKRIQLGQGITQGLVLHRVAPVYPPPAREARIQGTVVLAAIISKEGTIKDLRVISGPSTLVEAAVGAVQQWRYRPYTLAGEPVEVDTKIEVHFTLN